jgi:hypothetical protein
MCTRCHEEKDLDRLRTQVRGTFRHKLLNSSGNRAEKYVVRSKNIVLQPSRITLSTASTPPTIPQASIASNIHRTIHTHNHDRTTSLTEPMTTAPIHASRVKCITTRVSSCYLRNMHMHAYAHVAIAIHRASDDVMY